MTEQTSRCQVSHFLCLGSTSRALDDFFMFCYIKLLIIRHELVLCYCNSAEILVIRWNRLDDCCGRCWSIWSRTAVPCPFVVGDFGHDLQICVGNKISNVVFGDVLLWDIYQALITIWSSNMAGWQIPLWKEVFIGKSPINGPSSSTPCLMKPEGKHIIPIYFYCF